MDCLLHPLSCLCCRFLLQCLEDLDASLRKLNSRLFVIRGQPTDVFPRLFKVQSPVPSPQSPVPSPQPPVPSVLWTESWAAWRISEISSSYMMSMGVIEPQRLFWSKFSSKLFTLLKGTLNRRVEQSSKASVHLHLTCTCAHRRNGISTVSRTSTTRSPSGRSVTRPFRSWPARPGWRWRCGSPTRSTIWTSEWSHVLWVTCPPFPPHTHTHTHTHTGEL